MSEHENEARIAEIVNAPAAVRGGRILTGSEITRVLRAAEAVNREVFDPANEAINRLEAEETSYLNTRLAMLTQRVQRLEDGRREEPANQDLEERIKRLEVRQVDLASLASLTSRELDEHRDQCEARFEELSKQAEARQKDAVDVAAQVRDLGRDVDELKLDDRDHLADQIDVLRKRLYSAEQQTGRLGVDAVLAKQRQANEAALPEVLEKIGAVDRKAERALRSGCTPDRDVAKMRDEVSDLKDETELLVRLLRSVGTDLMRATEGGEDQ